MGFNELSPDQFHLVPKNEIYTRFPLINAVVSGVQCGKVFINESNESLITHKAGFSLIAINPYSGHENELVDFFENSVHLPAYFHVYSPSPLVIDLMEQKKDSFNLKIRRRIQLRGGANALSLMNNEKKGNTHGLTVCNVNEYNFDSLNDLGLDLENRFWSSKADFLKNGLGVCMLSEDKKPVSLCYSACLVDDIAEIDIKTHPDYQRTGFGQIVANEFMRLSLQNGITPNWDCFEDNHGSIATALKAGFKVVHKYQFVSVFNKKR